MERQDQSLELVPITFFSMFTGEKKAAALWAVLSFYDNNNIYEGVKQVKE